MDRDAVTSSRRTWEFGPPEFLMAGHLRHLHRHPREHAAGVRQRHQRALGAGRLPLRRPRPDLDRDPGRGGPVPGRPGQQRRAGLADPAQSGRARRGVGRDAAVGPVPVGGPRGVLRAGPLACGTTRTGPSGAPDSVVRPSTRSCPIRPTRSGSRWPCRPAGSTGRRTAAGPGTRTTPASRPTSSPTRGPSSASACTRSPRHPDRPELMYAQNHHGVYRSDDGGTTWTSIAEGLPADFGFPIVVHPHDPETVFVFPLVADGERIPPERARPGSGARPTPGAPGPRRAAACRTASTPR